MYEITFVQNIQTLPKIINRIESNNSCGIPSEVRMLTSWRRNVLCQNTTLYIEKRNVDGFHKYQYFDAFSIPSHV